MTFFAPNGQPLTPGTPQYTQAITQQVAQAAYTEEQLRRREEQLRREGADDVPPVPHVPSSRPEPARYVPGEMPRPPRRRRWIGCWGWLAIFFLACALSNLDVHDWSGVWQAGLLAGGSAGVWVYRLGTSDPDEEPPGD